MFKVDNMKKFCVCSLKDSEQGFISDLLEGD